MKQASMTSSWLRQMTCNHHIESVCIAPPRPLIPSFNLPSAVCPYLSTCMSSSPPPISCHWYVTLIHDVRATIRGMLDPVSSLALALACKKEFVAIWPTRDPYKNGLGSLQSMIEYGHDALALRCYPKLISRTSTDQLARHGALMCITHRYMTRDSSIFGCWHPDTAPLAARFGHLEVLMFVLMNGAPYHDELKNIAAEYGNLACLEYMHEYHSLEWAPHTLLRAARNGQLSCLKFAHENGCVLHRVHLVQAVMGGHFSCVKYCHENGVLLDSDIMGCAAFSGSVECMAYLRDKGAEWDEWVIDSAVRYGHLAALIYAHEHGCPWHRRVIWGAVVTGQKECALYAIRNGAQMSGVDMCDNKLREWMKEEEEDTRKGR